MKASMSSVERRPAIRELLSSAGAVFGAGSMLAVPLHFGDPLAEWRAVRTRTGILDAGFRQLWSVVGTDRISFLQGMLTADVARVQPGRGVYAAAVTVQGRIVSDARVYVAEERVWLDVPASHALDLKRHLEQYIVADDVEFEAPPSREQPLFVLEGRQAHTTAAAVFGHEVPRDELYRHVEVPFRQHKLRVVLVTHTGEMGYLLMGPPALAAEVWTEAIRAGATPVGWEALEVLRIEAGIPRVGQDMDRSTLIAEVGIEAAVSFGKGCYLGQEVVERVTARGQVQRRRVGFMCAGGERPPTGAKVYAGEREVGRVSSAVHSPALERIVGFAYVRREFWNVGQPLEVRWESGAARIEVAHVPFLALPASLGSLASRERCERQEGC